MSTSKVLSPQTSKQFYPPKTQYRQLSPYDALRWLLDQKRYEDAIVWWTQEQGRGGGLDFFKTEWSVTPFVKEFSLPAGGGLVSLKLADFANSYVSKGIPEPLAAYLLKIQSEGRIIIGRWSDENLSLITEPYDGEPIHRLRHGGTARPHRLRSYKRPRRLDIGVHVYLGPNPWPNGSAPEYGREVEDVNAAK